MADAPLKEAVRINEACRQHGVAFVKAEIRGVFANVFSDFGPAFSVLDVDGVRSPLCSNDFLAQSSLRCTTHVFQHAWLYYISLFLDAGEEPFMGIVAGITPGPTTLVTCVEDERLEFQVCTLQRRTQERTLRRRLYVCTKDLLDCDRMGSWWRSLRSRA